MCSSSTDKARLLSRAKESHLAGAGDRVPDGTILAEDARLQERLDHRQDPLVSDPSPHPLY
jgi:hypothetical protein